MATSQHPVQVSPDKEENHTSIGRYIATRVSSLVPPMNPAPNPFKALTLLNGQQWLFFSVSLCLNLISRHCRAYYPMHYTSALES